MILGDIPLSVHWKDAYWHYRNIWLDCRGSLVIEPDTHFGWNVCIYTRKHTIDGLDFQYGSVDAPVTIRRGAQIYSNAVLSDCEIGEQAIVCAGAVVVGRDVKPRTMVAGNPAQVIKKWSNGKWVSQ